MQVRDILEMEPTMEGTSGLGTDGPQPCTVIWVHPAKRFFVVEFRSRITGETWREAFWPELAPLFKAAAMRSEDQTKGER